MNSYFLFNQSSLKPDKFRKAFETFIQSTVETYTGIAEGCWGSAASMKIYCSKKFFRAKLHYSSAILFLHTMP